MPGLRKEKKQRIDLKNMSKYIKKKCEECGIIIRGSYKHPTETKRICGFCYKKVMEKQEEYL